MVENSHGISTYAKSKLPETAQDGLKGYKGAYPFKRELLRLERLSVRGNLPGIPVLSHGISHSLLPLTELYTQPKGVKTCLN